MAITDRHLVRRLLYDLVGGQRFTQDTPIMPDVWLAYAQAPLEPHDLILTPTRDSSAGRVAKELRWLLKEYRDKRLKLRVLELGSEAKVPPRLVHLPGLITARLYFDELMRIVLAVTPWWKLRPQILREDKEGALFGFPDPEDGDVEKMTDALVEALERARTRGSTPGRRASAEPQPDLVWVVRLAGAIALSCCEPGETFDDPRIEQPILPETFKDRLEKYLTSTLKSAAAESAEQKAHLSLSRLLARSFLEIYRGWPVESPPEDRLLWRITLNRPAEAAVRKSALTVKADAARLLFEISCRKITWAVVDSGIDRDHPAFEDHAPGSRPARDTLDESHYSREVLGEGLQHPSRVDRTFDLTNLRELLDLYVIESFSEPEPLAELKGEIEALSDGLEAALKHERETFDERRLKRQLDQFERCAKLLREDLVPQAPTLLALLERRHRPAPVDEPPLLRLVREIAELRNIFAATEELKKRIAGELGKPADRAGGSPGQRERELEERKRKLKAGLDAIRTLKARLEDLHGRAQMELEKLRGTARKLREALGKEARGLLGTLERRRVPPYNLPELWPFFEITELLQIFDDLTELRTRIETGHENDWGLLERFIEDRDPEKPKNEHGTHVAGILGADWRGSDGRGGEKVVMKGICPDIRLIDVRVLRDDGESDEFEVMAAIQYLRYRNSRAGYMDVHGANLSLSIRHQVADYACGRTPVCEECEEAVALGMVVVAAAGNRGFVQYKTADGSLDGYSTVSVTDPGNADAVITVGATHRTRPHEYGVSYFSSRGPTGDGRIKPDLVAPGEKIKSPVPGGGDAYKDGTSMSAPHVSGAAAMLMARHKELIGRPARIKRILCDTATDLGRERYFQGAGMLDILRALQSI